MRIAVLAPSLIRGQYDHADSRVFLDSRCIRLGDDWDTELSKAQRRSLVTVVLVSENTETAYYQREEVAAAIAFAREEHGMHRVVPIYINAEPNDATIPYGLRLKHGIVVGKDCSLADAAAKLLNLHSNIRVRIGSRVPSSEGEQPVRRPMRAEQRLGITREELRWGLTVGNSLPALELGHRLASIGPGFEIMALPFAREFAELLKQGGFVFEVSTAPDELIRSLNRHYAMTSSGKHAAIFLGLAASRARGTEPEAEQLAANAMSEIDPALLPDPNRLLGRLRERKSANVTELMRLLDEGW